MTLKDRSVDRALWAAHEAVSARRPARDADLDEFLKYHRDNVTLYESGGWEHWAERERHYLRQITKRIEMEAGQQGT